MSARLDLGDGIVALDGLDLLWPEIEDLEVHVAGGFEYFGYWLDAHSGPCDDELMAILSATLPLLRNVRAVVFEALPNHFVEMGAEADAFERWVAGRHSKC